MKKLNLSTAFIQSYVTITDSECKYQPVDFAVMNAIMYCWNSRNWSDEGYVTTIGTIAWQIGTRPIAVRSSIKRLIKMQLLTVTPVDSDENRNDQGEIVITNRTKLTMTRGAIFDDYKFFSAIQYNQSNNKINTQTTLQLS